MKTNRSSNTVPVSNLQPISSIHISLALIHNQSSGIHLLRDEEQSWIDNPPLWPPWKQNRMIPALNWMNNLKNAQFKQMHELLSTNNKHNSSNKIPQVASWSFSPPFILPVQFVGNQVSGDWCRSVQQLTAKRTHCIHLMCLSLVSSFISVFYFGLTWRRLDMVVTTAECVHERAQMYGSKTNPFCP